MRLGLGGALCAVVLAQVESAPLDSVAMEINRRSLNIGAELLLQWAAGSQATGPSLLTEHDRRVVGPMARVHLVDGSGLSEENRMSPLTQMLYLARLPQLPGHQRFPLLLPAKGTGTLRRLRYGMSRGVVHAKTGTLDDVAAFLEAALEDSVDDPSAVPHALGIIARSQNMSELARRVGMSRDGLYKALSADGNPTWSTILKVTNALGLRFELHPAAS